MTRQISLDGPFMVVGERINPTGKKKLQAELREGVLDTVMTMAEEQMEKGASILDINVGMNGIDEKEMMVRVVYEVSQAVNIELGDLACGEYRVVEGAEKEKLYNSL